MSRCLSATKNAVVKGTQKESALAKMAKICGLQIVKENRILFNRAQPVVRAYIDFLQICLLPIQAAWSEWSDFTECSTTCGGGTKSRTRECRNHENKVIENDRCEVDSATGVTSSETVDCSIVECRKFN